MDLKNENVNENERLEEINKMKNLLMKQIGNQLNDLISKYGNKPKNNFLEFELDVYGKAHEFGRQLMEMSFPLVFGYGYQGSKYYDEKTDSSYSCVQKKNSRKLKTSLGTINFDRAYYQCDNDGSSVGLLDIQLGIHRKRVSPGLAYFALLGGTITSFEEASFLLKKFGMKISHTEIEEITEDKAKNIKKINTSEIKDIPTDCDDRIPKANINNDSPIEESKNIYVEMDGCHIPVRVDEEIDSEWTECKTLLVFEEDEEKSTPKKRVIKDKNYYSTLQKIKSFKKHAKVKIEQFCKDDKVNLIFLGDGAKWIWNLARELVPDDKKRIEILDWYHVNERISILSAKLFPDSIQNTDKELFVDELKRCFRHDNYDEAITILNQKYEKTKHKEIKEYIYQMINYFDRNRIRMDYKKYRGMGFSIGSGAIESANKNVIQRRLKVPGARWNYQNADAMAHLRAEYCNGRFDEICGIQNNPLIGVT